MVTGFIITVTAEIKTNCWDYIRCGTLIEEDTE